METIQTKDAAEVQPARKPSWIMRGTFLLGGGLWLLYPVAPQVFGLMQGEPMRWAYLWAWLENQVMAALKSVPLGQTDGQRLLLALAALLPGIADEACALGDDDLCNYAPGFAILCSRHETQYSRLFRS